MISILRRIPALGSFVLFIILVMTKLDVLQNWWNEVSTNPSPLVYLGPVALIALALAFRFILKQNRLQLNQYFLSVFFFLFIAIQSADDLILNEGMLLAAMHLTATYLIIRLYNKEESTNTLMAIGTLVGLGAVLDPAFIWLLPAYLLGLSYFVLVDFRKALIVIHYGILSAFLGYGTRFILDNDVFRGWSFLPESNRISQVIDTPLISGTYGSLLVVSLLVIMVRSNFLRVRSVKIRNYHTIFVLSIPFLLAYMLFSREVEWLNLGLLAFPFATILAYHFENSKRVWIYESLFVLFLFAMYFTRWYYGT